MYNVLGMGLSLPIVSDGALIGVAPRKSSSLLARGKLCYFFLRVTNYLMMFLYFNFSVILLIFDGKIFCYVCVDIFVVIFAQSMYISAINVRDRYEVNRC